MKHNITITIMLLGMFLVTQLIGLYVVNSYLPKQTTIINSTTNLPENITITPEIPYGMAPPEQKAEVNLVSILISFAIAIGLMFLLIKLKTPIIFRIWFFVVVAIALGLSINSFISKITYAKYIALGLGIILAYFKVFRKHILIHNITELLIYPGIAIIFVALLNVYSIIILLLLISAYDIYAVWYAGFMQKMAKYQINTVGIFGGFFVPYINKNQRAKIKELKLLSKAKKMKAAKKIKIELAILGGGDVVFPLIFAGIILKYFGMIPALIITIFATLSLFGLFLMSRKGKFYPAMPFLTVGCFVGFLLVEILRYFSVL